MPCDDSKDARTQKKLTQNTAPMKAYLSENAFMGLLLSSAEVFKRESLGYLLGYRLDDRFIVEHAFSLQTARRRRRGVVLRDQDQKRIEPILSNFVKLQIIGDFHSHTQYGQDKGLPVPSIIDINSMEEHNLYIIVAINELKKKKRWKETSDGSISGSIGNFIYKISAYYYAGSGSTPIKAPIFCPFPPGLKVG
jgi:proteasome lid subunit RPN8/RPN11